jgi:hypothetical protein
MEAQKRHQDLRKWFRCEYLSIKRGRKITLPLAPPDLSLPGKEKVCELRQSFSFVYFRLTHPENNWNSKHKINQHIDMSEQRQNNKKKCFSHQLAHILERLKMKRKKHRVNINNHMRLKIHIHNIPLKQMKTDIGNVRTIRTMEPTVANISISPPLCPSAEKQKNGKFNVNFGCQID